MHAAHHRDRAGLPLLVIAALDQVAVLALRAHHGRDVALVRLHAIGAVIDPAGVGVAHHHHVAGADVIAAVVLVPARHRDFENVDVLAGVHVLHQRAGLHDLRRNGLGRLHVLAPVVHQLDGVGVGVEAERDVDAPHRGQDIREDAVAAREAGHVVEQHRLVADAALVDVDDAADLLLALGALDVLHLVVGAQLRQPVPQILLRARFRFGFRRLRGLLCRLCGSRFDGRIHGSLRSLSAAIIDRFGPFYARRAKSSFNRCGVTGSCVTAPGMPMASSMAEAMVAPTPVMPLSPAPLMPSGLSGVV